MSNQDRAAKARDKAFKKASEHMAANRGGVYETSEDYAWNLIWDRALRYADKWWDKQLEEARDHLEKARGKAVLLALDLNQVRDDANIQADELSRLRAENDRLKGQISNQMALLGAARNTAARLRKERDELKVAMTEMADRVHNVSLDQVVSDLRIANLRIENLKRRLNTAEAQLAEARALTTQGTTTVFEENERLVSEVRRLTSLLADEEEKTERQTRLLEAAKSAHRASLSKRDELIAECADLRAQLKKATRDCGVKTGTVPHEHLCTLAPGHAVTEHRCGICGYRWSRYPV